MSLSDYEIFSKVQPSHNSSISGLSEKMNSFWAKKNVLKYQIHLITDFHLQLLVFKKYIESRVECIHQASGELSVKGEKWYTSLHRFNAGDGQGINQEGRANSSP